MTKLDYVYVTYIATTPEKIWAAITVPEITRSYWFNHRNASDWQQGSPWSHQDYDDATEVDAAGVVIESEPPNRLVLSWGDPDETGDDPRISRVTFEIRPDRGVVRLQITHEQLDQKRLELISFGWPLVLSNLKTLLETGQTLLQG